MLRQYFLLHRIHYCTPVEVVFVSVTCKSGIGRGTTVGTLFSGGRRRLRRSLP